MARAPPIFSRPKNTGGQAKFKSICIMKKAKGSLFSFVIPPFIKSIKEIAIRMYKTVHTGANSQSGGFKKGLLRLSNHSVFFIVLC